MFSQKMTISFLLDLNLNVTWTNIKLPNIVQCKQNVTKGAAANAAAVSFIVQGSQLCHLRILEMNFLYNGAGLPVRLNEDSVIAFFNGPKQSGIFFMAGNTCRKRIECTVWLQQAVQRPFATWRALTLRCYCTAELRSTSL